MKTLEEAMVEAQQGAVSPALPEELGVEVCVKCGGELEDLAEPGPDGTYQRDDGDWVEMGAITKACAVCGEKAWSRIYFPKAVIAEMERQTQMDEEEK